MTVYVSAYIHVYMSMYIYACMCACICVHMDGFMVHFSQNYAFFFFFNFLNEKFQQ